MSDSSKGVFAYNCRWNVPADQVLNAAKPIPTPDCAAGFAKDAGRHLKPGLQFYVWSCKTQIACPQAPAGTTAYALKSDMYSADQTTTFMYYCGWTKQAAR